MTRAWFLVFGAIGVIGCESEPTIKVELNADKLIEALEKSPREAPGANRLDDDQPRRGEPAVADQLDDDDEPKPGPMPAGAAKTIRNARAAIAARDFRALEALLSTEDIASYQISRDLTAKNRATAIQGWRANPAALARIGDALAATCEAEPPDEDGLVLVSCGSERSGSTFVLLSNLNRGSKFSIYAVDTVH